MQVEYAMEAINNAGSTVGVLCQDGIVIGAERKQTSKLLERSKYSEKMYQIDSHLVCAAAGLTADANILINYARNICQQYQFTYHQQIPVEQLVRQLCNAKQGYTQNGGLRPFGVSFLYAGWDSIYGSQLYCSDPSGNYLGWKAIAIGANNQSASGILKQDYDENCSLRQAMGLVAKVICKSMDTTTPTPDKSKLYIVEIITVTKDKQVNYRALNDEEVQSILTEFNLVS
jgi:20S proteasome subunit alpha 3